jgi:hypothetical protein
LYFDFQAAVLDIFFSALKATFKNVINANFYKGFWKNRTLFISGCAPGSYGLLWLAAVCTLACQQLKPVSVASFKIQLLS